MLNKRNAIRCGAAWCSVWLFFAVYHWAEKTKFPWFWFQFFQIRKSLVQLQHIQHAGASYCNTLKHSLTQYQHFTTLLFYSKIVKYTMDERTQKRWIRWNWKKFESLNTVIDFDFKILKYQMKQKVLCLLPTPLRQLTNNVWECVCACVQWRTCCGDSCSSSSTCQRAQYWNNSWEPRKYDTPRPCGSFLETQY